MIKGAAVTAAPRMRMLQSFVECDTITAAYDFCETDFGEHIWQKKEIIMKSWG